MVSLKPLPDINVEEIVFFFRFKSLKGKNTQVTLVEKPQLKIIIFKKLINIIPHSYLIRKGY